MDLRILHKMRIFRLDDIVGLSHNESTAKSFLQRQIALGTICRVRKNLYAIADLATGRCALDKYEIASHLTPTATLAYHSAMEYHGFGHQAFGTVTVMSEEQFRPFEFEGISYVCMPMAFSQGVQTDGIASVRRCTNVERTIVDCINRIKYAGGLEELLHNLETIHYVDEGLLRQYLDLYGKKALYQRAGFLLYRYRKQMRLSASFFACCRKEMGSSVRYLVSPSEDNVYDPQWELCVPKYLEHLTTERGLENV